MAFDFSAVLTGLHELVPQRPARPGEPCRQLMSVMLDCETPREALDGSPLRPHVARLKVPVRDRPRIPGIPPQAGATTSAMA